MPEVIASVVWRLVVKLRLQTVSLKCGIEIILHDAVVSGHLTRVHSFVLVDDVILCFHERKV